MPTALGSVTKHKFEKSPEAHKLHNEFVVASGQAAHETDPVVLTADGEVQAAAAGASAETLIGVAMTDAVADERVTISMKGYTLVHALSGQINLPAGPVELGAWDGTYGDGIWDTSAKPGLRKYVAASSAAKTVGHCITPADADGDPIQVCILL